VRDRDPGRAEATVVTGAGSGIGRGPTVRRARRSARPAVSDTHENGLDETVERIPLPVPARGPGADDGQVCAGLQQSRVDGR
jgi:NAD(P)-dependent dehydrogenase (short-subunit alcohol dehydrogenase family)